MCEEQSDKGGEQTEDEGGATESSAGIAQGQPAAKGGEDEKRADESKPLVPAPLREKPVVASDGGGDEVGVVEGGERLQNGDESEGEGGEEKDCG